MGVKQDDFSIYHFMSFYGALKTGNMCIVGDRLYFVLIDGKK